MNKQRKTISTAELKGAGCKRCVELHSMYLLHNHHLQLPQLRVTSGSSYDEMNVRNRVLTSVIWNRSPQGHGYVYAFSCSSHFISSISTSSYDMVPLQITRGR
eukprot:GHUV01032838.1.p1 GENE.GHUV01032838.1~~GHUV01032838.1.p1  ORF type:complete len:103 (-),score=16.28 GHUV01032838.1:236-544(-)